MNNAVSRAAQLIAVASLPALAGIVGGVIAWYTISDDVLSEDAQEPTFHCGAESTPIR